MAIVGIGVDLARIDRFKRFVADRRTVLERLFAPSELEYALAKKRPEQYLAARFAAKEAFLKALGTGLSEGLSWQQIIVVRDDSGCPALQLSGRAAALMAERGGRRSHLSCSHDGDYAVATVILEG